MSSVLGMRKCDSGEHIKHNSTVEQILNTHTRYDHTGLSGIGVLCNQNRLALKSFCDWKSLQLQNLIDTMYNTALILKTAILMCRNCACDKRCL